MKKSLLKSYERVRRWVTWIFIVPGILLVVANSSGPDLNPDGFILGLALVLVGSVLLSISLYKLKSELKGK